MTNHDLKLVALDARTGALYPGFGENGYVDLTQGYSREIDASRMTYSSPVAVAGDTIITGSIIQDTYITEREASPGDVRAYDARTGEMKWIFHTIPQGDEFGADSWQNESWRYSGHTNVWSYMAVDEELGLVYLPTGTPSNDWYGGMRPGNNLFAESIVAVDIETGQREWHFQAVHHGLWDWDFPTGPNLPRHHRRRPRGQGAGPGQQAGVHLRLRSGDRRADLAHRGAPRAPGQRAGRVVLPDPAVPHEAAPVRPGRASASTTSSTSPRP